MCRVYVHGRVAPGECRGSEEGSKGGRSYRANKCGARAVGSVTSTSEVDAICVQCMYMEESSPGSLHGPQSPSKRTLSGKLLATE